MAAPLLARDCLSEIPGHESERSFIFLNFSMGQNTVSFGHKIATHRFIGVATVASFVSVKIGIICAILTSPHNILLVSKN